MKTAVVHDGTVHPGGAVDVVVEAANALDADLYVGFSGKNSSWWEERVVNDIEILRKTYRTGTLNDIRTARLLLNLDLQQYDVVLSSGPASKFFQPYDDQLQIHYLHHPPLSSLWFTGGLFDYITKSIDRVETASIPHVIANSELTATRTHRQYNRTVDTVIPPPVDIDSFSPKTNQSDRQLVLVGRLEDRKRPMIAVEAMQELPHCTLKIIGDGPLRNRISKEAPGNVELLGYVDDSTLRRTVEQSAAGIFLAEREDFGITPIEYMAAGIPVVGVDEPNTSNQVDDASGILVKPEPQSVVDGIKSVLHTNWNRQKIRDKAEKYSTPRFRDDIRAFVETVYF